MLIFNFSANHHLSFLYLLHITFNQSKKALQKLKSKSTLISKSVTFLKTLSPIFQLGVIKWLINYQKRYSKITKKCTKLKTNVDGRFDTPAKFLPLYTLFSFVAGSIRLDTFEAFCKGVENFGLGLISNVVPCFRFDSFS